MALLPWSRDIGPDVSSEHPAAHRGLAGVVSPGIENGNVADYLRMEEHHEASTVVKLLCWAEVLRILLLSQSEECILDLHIFTGLVSSTVVFEG